MRGRMRRRLRWWEAVLVMVVGLTAGQLISGNFNGHNLSVTLVSAVIAAPLVFLVDLWVQRRDGRKQARLISQDPDDYR